MSDSDLPGLLRDELRRIREDVKSLDEPLDRLAKTAAVHGEQLRGIARQLEEGQERAKDLEEAILGESGLRVRVAQLEDREKNRTWRERGLWATALGALASGVLALFSWLLGSR